MTSAVTSAAPRPTKRKTAQKPKLVRRPPQHPRLRLTPYAWAKLLYWRDAGPTEIGGLGISAPGDPLLLTDIRLVRQRCDWASVQFDDGAVADYFDEQVDAGRRPEEFGRVWVHTHPGESPSPSATDKETFGRVFGACQWAVMFILAQGGQSYARLTFGVGPGGSGDVPVEVDYESEFPASERGAWEAEYAACVERAEPSAEVMLRSLIVDDASPDWFDDRFAGRSFGEGDDYDPSW